LLPNQQIRYTRAGAFRMDSNGQLVTTDGYLLNPPITIQNGVDLSSLTIGTDGTITGTLSGSPDSIVNLGQLQLAKFSNPAGLSSEGGNLYAATPASGTAILSNPGIDGMGTLRQ